MMESQRVMDTDPATQLSPSGFCFSHCLETLLPSVPVNICHHYTIACPAIGEDRLVT